MFFAGTKAVYTNTGSIVFSKVLFSQHLTYACEPGSGRSPFYSKQVECALPFLTSTNHCWTGKVIHICLQFPRSAWVQRDTSRLIGSEVLKYADREVEHMLTCWEDDSLLCTLYTNKQMLGNTLNCFWKTSKNACKAQKITDHMFSQLYCSREL